MDLLQSPLPSASLLRLDSYAIDPSQGNLTFNLTSTQTIAECPLCGGFTQRVHSRDERTLADLPCMHFSLKLLVQVCKFFCPNTDCRRCIFTERLPKVAAPWARKTVRFVGHLQAIGLALGGAAGARLGMLLGYVSSASTLLNHLQPIALPHFETPKILGVDDFAFRKGHNYGTILVAAFLVVLKPENRDPDDTAVLGHLASQHSDIKRLIDLADEFLKLLRQQKADDFDSWVLKAVTCKIQPLQKFAEGLLDDYDAVKACMSTEVSNGPVEGLNNKLKMLKRQMYGRAGLDLLTKRFIMAS